MRALIPYVGQPRANPLSKARVGIVRPRPLVKILDEAGENKALMLFRIGNDTADIAEILNCSPAAAANGLARARDRERGQ